MPPECPPGLHSMFDPCPGDCLNDTDCVDSDGEVWPEHDYPVDIGECRRCGAEPDDWTEPDGVYNGEIR